MHKTIAVAGLAIGAGALILQAALTIPARLNMGDSLIGAVFFYFSFFTILTNLGLVLTYAASLAPGFGGWFRRESTRTMLAGLILIVMAVYHFVLAGVWSPQGLYKVADVALHYVTPVTYILWWAVSPRKALGFNDIPKMLIAPALYLLWALGRGAVTGLFPYHFLDAGQIGWLQVVFNLSGIIFMAMVLFLVFIGIGRVLARR